MIVKLACSLVRFSCKSVRAAGRLAYSPAISLYFHILMNGCMMAFEILGLPVFLPTSPRSCFRFVLSNSLVS